jgi:hypothetical protein
MDQPTSEPALQALEHLLIVHLGSVLARDLPAGVTNPAGPCLRPCRCRGVLVPVHWTPQPSETTSAELQSGRRARRRERQLAFLGRTAEAGVELGSRLVAARLVRDVMRLAFHPGADVRAVHEVVRYGIQ